MPKEELLSSSEFLKHKMPASAEMPVSAGQCQKKSF
jgi:hypothetical protein